MKSSENKTSLAIMAIFFIIPGALIVNPAIQTIADAYPSIPYTIVLLLSTIPLLIIVPTTLISGAIAGTKIRYKTLLLISIVLYVVGGSLPFFVSDFYIVLGSRAIYGVGLGLATPLANSLVIRLYEGQKRANMMGIGSVVINIASTIYMLLSGFISAIQLNFMWLIHLIALIPLVLILIYLPEPEKIEHHGSGKAKLPVSVFIISLSLCFIYMNLNPLLLNMSAIVTSEKIGNAAVAGTILSMYTIGGILGGLVFGKLYKTAGKFTIPLSLIILAGGLGISSFAHSVMIMIVGCTVAGVGFFIIFPAVLMEAGRRVPRSVSAMLSAMILGAINLGGFLSSFYIGVLGKLFGNASPRLPILIGTIIIMISALIWGMFAIVNKPKADLSVQ